MAAAVIATGAAAFTGAGSATAIDTTASATRWMTVSATSFAASFAVATVSVTAAAGRAGVGDTELRLTEARVGGVSFRLDSFLVRDSDDGAGADEALGATVSSSSSSDAVWSSSCTVVPLSCAPPVLTATPDGALTVPLDVMPDAGAEFDGCVAGCVEPEVPDGASVEVSVVDAADGELGSGVSADATPWPAATAMPTPNATAKAPTRPTYALAPIIAPMESPDFDIHALVGHPGLP
ncbi:hypothetical protein [Mycobacterium sp. URHB0044]|uniref:hypothetical protein n=1 Tax=Mycobacterium sp. URHB0044 TaxID=1380386 RepID=UPI001E5A55F3|nr:hypothetical protein [Mycobacterium sp. URHB0044]